jgi:serine/threonine protein kinase
MNIVKFRKEYKKDHIIPNGIHNESELYLYNGDIIKLFNKRISFDRQRTILSLDEIERQECIIPKYSIIYGNNIVGYGMEYLKDFSTLFRLIEDESLSFSDRKQIAIKLYQIIMYLERIGVCYPDIHTGNFLYKDGIVRVIDMDSVMLDKVCVKDNFNHNIELSYLRLARLCFTILINMRVILPFELNSIEQSDIIEFFDGDKKDYFKYIFGYEKSDKYFIDTIDRFTEEDSILIRSYLK